METILQKVHDNVVSGEVGAIRQAVQAAINADVAPERILNQAMIKAMQEVGIRFERQEYYLPEMLMAAQAMHAGLDVLRPYLVESGAQAVAKVAIGTVQGDLHDIGKDLVAMMLEGAGFEVVNLGTDVAPEAFVNAVRNGAELVGMSALLTTTMMNMPSVIRALSEAGVRDKVRIIIGGAPVTMSFCDQIEADGYAPDASRVVDLAKGLLNIL